MKNQSNLQKKGLNRRKEQELAGQLARKVAELEETSKALQLSEQLFKNILNSLSANIAIIDPDGIIIETNQAWRRFAEDNHLKMATRHHRGKLFGNM